jgi:signal transduction histidine kinase
MVVLGPLALITLAREWPALRREQWAGAVILLLVTLGVVGGLFFSQVAPQSPLVPLAFAVFPLFVAAALYFGTAGATVASLVLCLIVSGGTMFARGPFSTTGTSEFNRQFLGQLFVLLLALSALVVGGLTNDGRAARATLSKTLRELRDSTSRLQAFFATAPEATAVFDNDGVLLAVNEAFGQIMERVTGVRPTPGEHRDRIDARAPAEWGALCLAAWAGAARGERRVALLPTKEGAVQMTLAPVRDPGGAVIGVSKQLHDVDAAERLQQRRARAERLESVGRLAGGVAHDFNNLLTVIIGHAGTLRDEALDPEAARDAEEIEAAALRAAGLTKQLLQFARREVVEPRAVDLGERVRGMEGLLTRLVGEDVSGGDRPPPGDPRGADRPGSPRAGAAQPGGQRARRDARRRPGDPPLAAVHRHARGGSRARTGAGPGGGAGGRGPGHGHDAGGARAHLRAVLHHQGGGPRHGLATTDGIVRQAGGAIAVDSTPGKGTLFRVIFPRHDGPVLATVPAAPRVQRGGTETVLLVEDEAAIRALAARSLRLAGYQVLEAARGDIALAVARAHQGEIALLVTDVVLPGGGGQGVAATLLAERPRMKVLYVSGYSEHVLLPQAGQAAAFLPKPYKPEALLERARAVLDETLAA